MDNLANVVDADRQATKNTTVLTAQEPRRRKFGCGFLLKNIPGKTHGHIHTKVSNY